MAFVRRLLLWNLLAAPVGAVAGGLLEAFGPGADSFLSGTLTAQGILFGGAIGLVAGSTAALTNTVFSSALHKAGSSSFLTGVLVSGGTLTVGLVLLNV